jgi:hypothetical protein
VIQAKNSAITWHQGEIDRLRQCIRKREEEINECTKYSDDDYRRPQCEYAKRQISECSAAISILDNKLRLLEQASPEIKITTKFEVNSIDVLIQCTPTFGEIDEKNVWEGVREAELVHAFRSTAVYVECKPSVGDDYPAVLRQMSAQMNATSNRRCRSVLFIGQGGYTGTGATFEQVKAIFKSRGIAIVLLCLVPHNAEIHRATLGVHEWLRQRLSRALLPLPKPRRSGPHPNQFHITPSAAKR